MGRQAREAFQVAVIPIFWCLLLLTLSVPFLVRGHSAIQDSLSISSNSDRHSRSSFLGNFGSTKDKKEQPTVGGYPVLKGFSESEDKQDAAFRSTKGNKESNPTGDTKKAPSPWQFQVLGISCTDSMVSSVLQDESANSSAADGLKHPSLLFGSVPTAGNVAIIPPVLKWGRRFLFTPLLRSLTIVNTWNDSGIFVFQPFSTTSDFYATGFQETWLPPGGMMTIHVIFLPKKVGFIEGSLVVQTTAGGFLIQLLGEGIESPYRLQALPSFNNTSEKFLHSLMLYNPFDEPLIVEEVSVGLAGIQKMSSHAFKRCEDRLKRVSCKRENNTLNGSVTPGVNSDWIQVMVGECCNQEEGVIRIRPAGQWEIEPYTSNAILDLEVSANNEKAVLGALCIKLARAMADVQNSLILPFNLQPGKVAGYQRKVHVKPNTLDFGILTHKEQKIKQNFVLVNPGPDPVLVEEIYPLRYDGNIVSIEYGDLILQPGTETHVATITYVAYEPRIKYVSCTSNESGSWMEFKVMVKINSTINPHMEVPYQAVVLLGANNGVSPTSADQKSKRDITLAATLTEIICKSNWNSHLQDGFCVPHQVFRNLEKRIQALELGEALQLGNPNSNAQLASGISVLQDSELVFPTTSLGRKEMRWVYVRNPSDKPIIMQLLISSEAGAINSSMNNGGVPLMHCDSNPWSKPGQGCDSFNVKHLQVSQTQNATFSIAERDVIEVVLQPNSTDGLGPIIFEPVEQCLSTAIIIVQNNLTGIEWMPVQGYGGSPCLTFSDGSDTTVQILELDFNSTLVHFPVKKTLKEHIDDLLDDRVAKSACHKRMFQEFMAKNTGDVFLQVESLRLTGGDGGPHGFRIDSSKVFYLAPGQFTKFVISYQPDFTRGITETDLQLTTSFGMLTVPLRANLPEHMSSFCHKALFVSRAKRLCLYICCVALCLVLLVFFKMLKQERVATSDAIQWPSVNTSGNVCQHVAMKAGQVCVKTGGAGLHHHDHKKQKILETLLFSLSNGSVPPSDLDRPCCNGKSLSSSFSMVGVIFTFLGNLTFTIRSFSLSETLEGFPNLKVRILSIGKPLGGALEKFDSSHTKDTAHVSNKISEKKGHVSHTCSQSLKSVDWPSSAMCSAEVASFATPDVSYCDTSRQEIAAEATQLSESFPVLNKVQTLSTKPGPLEKEKDKGKRKKRKNGVSFLRQRVENGGRSGSSSPVSSPSSPAASNCSSRPVSPFLQQASLSGTTMDRVAADQQNHMGSNSGHSQETESMKNTEVEWNVSGESQSAIDTINGFSVGNARKGRKGKAAPIARDWEANAPRESVSKSQNHNDGDHQSGTTMDNARNRATLTTCATFPRYGRRSDKQVPATKEASLTMSASMSNFSLVSTSTIAPHARAPGTRISKQCVVGTSGEDQGKSMYKIPDRSYGVSRSLFEHSSNASDSRAAEFVYDIWGDHFAEISRATQSAWQNDFTNRNFSFLQDSQSLFSRTGFLMQSGSANKLNDYSIPAPATPGFSVFSAADPFLSSHPLEVLFGSHPSRLDAELH